MNVSTPVLVLCASWGIAGCVATQNDLRVVAGKVSYLESRIEKTEDLVTDISGSARQEVLQSRRDVNTKLDEVRKQSTELLSRIQKIEAEIKRLQGLLAETDGLARTALSAVTEVQASMADAAKSSRPAAKDDMAQMRWQSEQEIYTAAKKAFDDRAFDHARTLFATQLQHWPKGELVANALFWQGEIAYHFDDYLGAIEKYLTIAEQHSKSNKAPDAYLKLALSLEKLGEKTQARQTYQDLIRLYPESSQAPAAQKAVDRLSQ